MADVTVNISDASASVRTTDFSLILIVSDDAVVDYKEYDLSNGIANSGIDSDYTSSTTTYKMANAIAGQEVSPGKVAIIGCSSGVLGASDVIDKLNEMLQEGNGKAFRILTTYDDSATKLAIAKWAESNKKMAYIQYNVTTFTEDYSTVDARIVFHKTADEFLDAAEASYMATRTPGTAILKFKTFKLVTPQNLTADEITQAEAKNMGYYIKVVDIPMERSSKASSYSSSEPKYIDDLESRIYTAVTMENKLLSMLINQPKLPGDINGLSMIETSIGQVLNSNYNMDIIATTDNNKPDYEVDTDLAEFLKSDRSWNGIKFRYKYLHGTEKINVKGTVE